MTDKIAEMKALMDSALNEAKFMNDSFCNLRGILWWKTREHNWLRWRQELVYKNDAGGIIAYLYMRTCGCCGRDQWEKRTMI